MRHDRIARREYFSIGEVCEMAGLKPHVLRYWETQFKELSPSKNRAGNRVYRAREIKLIELEPARRRRARGGGRQGVGQAGGQTSQGRRPRAARHASGAEGRLARMHQSETSYRPSTKDKSACHSSRAT